MSDGPEGPETGRHIVHQIGNGVCLQVSSRKAIVDTAERPQPARGLRERDADVPTSSLAQLRHSQSSGSQDFELLLLRTEVR